MLIEARWLESLFEKEPKTAWDEIFQKVSLIANTERKGSLKAWYTEIENEIDGIESILSTSAWDLWQAASLATKGSAALIEFWNSTVGPKAVLILDSLSIREVGLVKSILAKNSLELVRCDIALSEIPSETDLYANALGLPGRAAIRRQSAPRSFKIDADDTYLDSFSQIPFSECSAKMPAARNVFIWHGWPDDSLHEKDSVEDSWNRFIDHAKHTIEAPDFGEFLRALCRGRDLLVTSDHGYCHASSFLVTTGQQHQDLRFLGHKRCKAITEGDPKATSTVPPITLDLKSTADKNTYRLAVGKKRPADRGFPSLTHGGLSIMECCVPLMRIREVGNG